MNPTKNKSEKGFSLMELMIVVVIIGILTAFILPALRNTGGEGKKVVSQIERALQERRGSAIRLNQAGAEGARRTIPVNIDFSNLNTTAPLLIDGEDANQDGIEDNSGIALTRRRRGFSEWSYSYEGKPIQLPVGWSIVSDVDGLGDIPQIPNSQLVTSISFDEKGKPVGSPAAAAGARRDEAAFFVIYARDSKDRKIVAAVAVHQSGLTEKWTWDFSDLSWSGSGGRK